MTFVFVSGALSLDFAGTRQWRRRPTPSERLHSPADVAQWAVEAGVLTVAPWVSAVELDGLIRLREAIYQLARGTPTAPDLMIVNAAASGPGPRLTLVDGAVVRSGDVGALASALATSALELVAAAVDVKECARDECTRLFVDRSRGGRRAWCGMEECGNQAKARAYRARRTGVSSP